jgi:hypothetical protein
MPRVKGTQLSGVVIIDRKRMDKALKGETFEIPKGLTREETKEFIKKMGEKNANDLPK